MFIGPSYKNFSIRNKYNIVYKVVLIVPYSIWKSSNLKYDNGSLNTSSSFIYQNYTLPMFRRKKMFIIYLPKKSFILLYFI